MVEYKKYDSFFEKEVLKIFTDAFFKYPLFYGAFEDVIKDEAKLYSLYETIMKAIFKATIRKNECIIGMVDGKVASIVIVQKPTDKPISVWDYVVSGMPKVLVKLGIKKTFEYLDFTDHTEDVVKSIKEPRWHLYFLAVDPSRHHEGLGTDAIQNYVIPLVKKNDGKLITVNTNAEKNVEFYKKNGFSVIEKDLHRFYGNTIINWTFRMDLKD